MELATCSYSEYRPEMGVAIRTTAGGARWFSHPLGGHAQLITPTRQLLDQKLPKDAYEFSYRRTLNERGIDPIHRELSALAAKHNGNRLVLLCFDRMDKPENWCHRVMFSAWWTEQTGEEIAELGDNCFDLSRPGQPGLF